MTQRARMEDAEIGLLQEAQKSHIHGTSRPGLSPNYSGGMQKGRCTVQMSKVEMIDQTHCGVEALGNISGTQEATAPGIPSQETQP